MAPSYYIDLTAAEQRRLLEIARASIRADLHDRDETGQLVDGLTPALQEKRAVFVTLTRSARLRGCIGTLEPVAPLATAVADSAHSAAFRDPRFPPMRRDELETITIEISVLTPTRPLAAASREVLLDRLRPGVDGLVLQDGRHRSTFLPKVWEQLPDPRDFLAQLLAKAGLPADHWSPSLQLHRYGALTFGDESRP
jgi:AmmeMemoRadiSam system protein A